MIPEKLRKEIRKQYFYDQAVTRNNDTGLDPKLLKMLTPDSVILKAGCGSAHTTALISHHLCGKGYALAADISLESLRNTFPIVKKTAAKNKLVLLQADAVQMPFADTSFDIIICRHLLMHINNPLSVLSEFRRMLKPGGFVRIQEGSLKHLQYFPQFKGWKIFMDFVSEFVTNPDIGNNLFKLLRTAGFSDLREEIIFSSAVNDDYRNNVLSWINALSDYSSILIEYGISDEKSISAILNEGTQMLNSEAGQLSCREYIISGKNPLIT